MIKGKGVITKYMLGGQMHTYVVSQISIKHIQCSDLKRC